MPTGLHNTPGPFGAGILGTGAGPFTGGLPKGAINKQVAASLRASGVPQPAPLIFVAPGENVFIRGSGSWGQVNQEPVYLGLSREDVNYFGKGYSLTPDTEISYPVDHTGQIWFNGTEGDSITISVRANQT
jgi:hypothetical protein